MCRREIKKLEETMQEATAEKANQAKEFSAVWQIIQGKKKLS